MEIKGYTSPGVLRRLVNFSLHLEMVLLCLDLLGNDIFDYFFFNEHEKSSDCMELLFQIHLSSFPEESLHCFVLLRTTVCKMKEVPNGKLKSSWPCSM